MSYLIEQAEFLNESVVRLRVRAADISRNAQAGQFVIVRQDEYSERIPLTIVEQFPEKQTITLVVQAAGAATQRLCELRKDDFIRDILGPLGNPAPIARYGTVACVAGGVGIAEMYPLTQALQQAGNNVVSILGGRTAELVILQSEMTSSSNRVIVTTDDGSLGRKGLVTGALQEAMVRESFAAVFCVGPVAMMAAVADTTREQGITTIASLNAIMVDGTGMCGSCRVTVGGQTRFVCVDGPDFNAHQVDFDELQTRQLRFNDPDKLYTCKMERK